METTLTIRHVDIDETRQAVEGSGYTDQFVGLTVTYTTWENEMLVGVVESFQENGFPIIRFPDGRWARGDRHMHVVETVTTERAEVERAIRAELAPFFRQNPGALGEHDPSL